MECNRQYRCWCCVVIVAAAAAAAEFVLRIYAYSNYTFVCINCVVVVVVAMAVDAAQDDHQEMNAKRCIKDNNIRAIRIKKRQ